MGAAGTEAELSAAILKVNMEYKIWRQDRGSMIF